MPGVREPGPSRHRIPGLTDIDLAASLAALRRSTRAALDIVVHMFDARASLSDPGICALHEEYEAWLNGSAARTTGRKYAGYARVWLAWSEWRRLDPLAVTWEDISAHLDVYEGDDPQRLTGIRKFCKWLTASGRIGNDPSAEQPEKTGCMHPGCPEPRYGAELCRGHHLAAGLSGGSEETCAECGHTKLTTEFTKDRRLCKQCRPTVRRRRREARIAAGDLKRCSRCQQDKPLTEYPTENSFCRACKSQAHANWGSYAGGAMLRGECENCGKPFTRSRSEGAGRFCSAGCATAGNRMRSPRTCAREGCSRIFVPHDERSMYCSRECGGLARRNPDAIITRTCRNCGSPFQVYRSYVNWGSGKYCSQECHLLDRSPTDPEERLYDLLDKVPGPGEWIPQYQALPGRKWVADAAVPCRLLILQADGDFWHGKDPAARANPKVASNRRRDAAFDAAAESQGWRVLRLWESELRDSPGACEARIRAALAEPVDPATAAAATARAASRKTRFRPRQVAGGRELTADETRRLATATTREEWAKIAAELACDGVTHSEIGQKTGFARVTVSARIRASGNQEDKIPAAAAASYRNRHNVVFNPTGKPRRQLTAYEVEFLTCARSIDEWAEIALALARSGVTQTEIARRTGLAQPTVSARILRVVKG